MEVHSDILEAIDSGQAYFLVLLDLSAAFDTLDHNILLQRLWTWFGIKGTALTWFTSYLSQVNLTCSFEVDIENRIETVLGLLILNAHLFV